MTTLYLEQDAFHSSRSFLTISCPPRSYLSNIWAGQSRRRGAVRQAISFKQVSAQTRDLGIGKADVIKCLMLGDTVGCRFTSLEGVTCCAVLLAGFPPDALTDESIVVGHGWFM